MREKLILEDSAGWISLPDKIKVDDEEYFKSRGVESIENKFIEIFRIDSEDWVKNTSFDEFRDKKIDLAIVFDRVDDSDAQERDVDNYAKTIISGLQSHHSDNRDRHLIEDDNQIRRLMVHKMDSERDERLLTVSFREYDPDKNMKMKPMPEVI